MSELTKAIDWWWRGQMDKQAFERLANESRKSESTITYEDVATACKEMEAKFPEPLGKVVVMSPLDADKAGVTNGDTLMGMKVRVKLMVPDGTAWVLG